jgi:hypothetical protein
MNREEIKKAIEIIEQINHSGSGRLAGIGAQAVRIEVHEKGVVADVLITGPRKGQVRKFENLEYSYEHLSQVIGKGK